MDDSLRSTENTSKSTTSDLPRHSFDPPDYRRIFEEAPVMLSVLDANLTVIASSNEYLEAVMRTPESLYGMNVYDAFPDDPDDPTSTATADLRASIERAIETRSSDWMAIVRYPIPRPEEEGGGFEARYWSPVNHPLFDEQGELEYMVQVVFEVTDYVLPTQPDSDVELALDESDRVAIEGNIVSQTRNLLEQNRQLHAAGEAKNEFLSRMSHELRTPLTAISGFAELMTVSDLDAETKEWAHTILKASRHLSGLVGEILDISRIESGELSLSIEPISLGQVLDDAMDLMRPLAERRAVDIVIDGEVREVYVAADKQRIKQVLINLLSNAIKYNREGGSVAVQCGGASKLVSIAISDTGPGLSEAQIARLFIPFERLDAGSSEIEGTGLGLPLSKNLVEAMGGRISVRSIQAEGSTFTVELVRVAPAAIEGVKYEDKVLEKREYARDCKLLYIEDTVANAKLVEQILSRRPSVTVVPAMQGRMGIELAREHVPEMILLDLHLPDMNGAEVLKELKADPQTRDIPVLILSADATRRQHDEVLNAGARDYLTKPIGVNELLRVVDKYIAKRLEL